ncbi:right-handed parallel beta-helix repeat-containing protein [Actinacidiphila bryophytorum]|uniref:right-handed parallel beta-helix repeat-containing protein n=1 Tax=Actinacidiphila bryophytorum TaxID=1436133 RepID=UPI0022457134|nr:right-handed parallel beta-helix repeat-containing protein [Actinacidiphila bryophytorum]
MTVAALGAGVAMAPAAHAEWGVQLVHEGQSIQAAVDAAADGDTVLVMPGTYRESVQITRNVTLEGVGSGLVTITAPAGQGVQAAPAAPSPAPGTAPAAAPVTGPAGTQSAAPAATPNGTASAAAKPGAAQSVTSTTGADMPAAGKPGVGKPDAGKPDTAKPDTAKPDAGKPDADMPAAGKPDAGKSDAAKTETSTTVTGTTTQAACAAAGHGICVTGADGHALTAVRIESVTVTGFRANGIDVSGTDGMVVRRVTVKNNGQQGISQEKSTRAVLRDNEAVGNGQSGIFVSNFVNAEGGALDTRGTVIAGNTLSGNRIGVTVRRARVMAVENNTVTGNCGGVFVVGDENNPKAGDLDIRQNKITDNNKFCASNGRLPAIQGTGVLLTGAEDTRVTDNTITGNSGTSPMSGGVVLYPSEVGVANLRDQVSGNTLTGNSPADLADRDTKGTGNTFSANSCSVSEPAGRC